MPTEMELTLEQTQQGVSHEVSVSIEEMEILLEPTSNKPMVGNLCDSIRIKLVTTGKKRWCDSVNTVSTPVSTASVFSIGGPSADYDDSQIPALEDIYENASHGIFNNASYDDEGAVADFTNLENTMHVSPIPTSRIHTIHPKS
ncbi:hypothetical protein Tco_0980749 [Tanacetum coccineum]